MHDSSLGIQTRLGNKLNEALILAWLTSEISLKDAIFDVAEKHSSHLAVRSPVELREKVYLKVLFPII